MIAGGAAATSTGASSNGQTAQKSLSPKAGAGEAAESAEEQLLDDAPDGITFKSFDIQEVLGQGTFGKVFKVNLKTDLDP